MKSKRESVLRELNELRKQPEPNFNKFNQLYHKHKKVLQPEDQSILDVYYVECKLAESKRKEALDWALSNFKLLEYNQDLKCLLGQIYYDDKNYGKSLYYFNKIDFQINKQQFSPAWYKDGTLQLCQSVSLELLINSIFKKGYLEYQHNNNPQKAVKSWECCFNLISSNVQSIAFNQNMHTQNDKSMINLPVYSLLAYQCIVNISRIMLQSGQLSSCLTNVRASLQLSSHLEDFFHRQMLFKLGLLTFHYLSPVNWNNNGLHSLTDTDTSGHLQDYCYIPSSIDQEAILALMVHQRLCQLTLQRSMRHKHRRRAQELRLQKLREQQKAINHQLMMEEKEKARQTNTSMANASNQTALLPLSETIETKPGHTDNTDNMHYTEEKTQILSAEQIESQMMDTAAAQTQTDIASQSAIVNTKYILADDETEQIEGQNLMSLLFLTILLSIRHEFYPLSKCILRSLNEKQIDCSRWYKYGLALYGNTELNECIRACHHALQNDTVAVGENGGNDKILRHHFILSACLLAARSSILLKDNKSALSYSRGAVRLSLDKQYLAHVNAKNANYMLVDQRSTAYLLFSIACSESANSSGQVNSFEDVKSLHKLAMKSIIRACILSPRNQSIVFNLASCRADLGDIDGSLDDIRSLLQNLHPFHSESWHLLSLLLSSKRKWMESYRAIDQSLRYCEFITGTGKNTSYHRIYYKYKLKLTKIKILMKQNRISSPLQIFNELCKLLEFNDKFYKMTKLPNSHKLCPLFQPISNKNDQLITITYNNNQKNKHSQYSLLLLRLEFILTLTSFYLQENVTANKYAFHCMEFALQFFGSCTKSNVILSDIYCKLGECVESLNQFDLALSHYKTSISYNSHHYNSLCGQSRIYLLNNKLLDSKSYLDKALKINAYHYKAWSILAQIQEQQKLYEKASNSYLTSLELQRDQPIEPYSSVPRWLP